MIAITPQTSALEAALLEAQLCHQAGQLTEAEDLYRRILHTHPDDVTALNEFGRVLQDHAKSEEAVVVFRRLVDLHPDMVLAHRNLGVVLCQAGLLEESFAAFRRHAEMTYGMTESYEHAPILPHQVLHDHEQRNYLNSKRGPNENLLTGNPFHIENGERVPGRAVNLDSFGDVATQWQSNRPQIVVVDDFLTQEALDKLRHFCWGSTIWRQAYTAGYLGAMPEHGLGSPLLAQIAEELRATHPIILGPHPLLHFWGFKYDSRLNGIAVHADFAIVNVNFWITPDDANLDPASGGLTIWDTPAPVDWNFSKYNDDVASTRNFLAQSGARATTIPYRSNRAVIFDSSLFHETDRILFKEDYLNRRINITFLYGKRSRGAVS